MVTSTLGQQKFYVLEKTPTTRIIRFLLKFKPTSYTVTKLQETTEDNLIMTCHRTDVYKYLFNKKYIINSYISIDSYFKENSNEQTNE